jgi:hypothetical protein
MSIFPRQSDTAFSDGIEMGKVNDDAFLSFTPKTEIIQLLCFLS